MNKIESKNGSSISRKRERKLPVKQFSPIFQNEDLRELDHVCLAYYTLPQKKRLCLNTKILTKSMQLFLDKLCHLDKYLSLSVSFKNTSSKHDVVTGYFIHYVVL